MDSDKPSRLGEILIRSGRLKPHQLGVALAVQQEKKMPLGQLLVEVKIITPTQLRMALFRQKLLRAGGRLFSTKTRLRDMGLDFAFRSQHLLEQHLATLENADPDPQEADKQENSLRKERASLPRGRIARIIEKDEELAKRLKSGNF